MSKIQELLDEEARLGNALDQIIKEIKVMRGTEPPCCWGEDDCSTLMLTHCPWRIDCGDTEIDHNQYNNYNISPNKVNLIMKFKNNDRAVVTGTMSTLDGKEMIITGVTVVGYGTGSHFYHIKQADGKLFDNDGENWDTISVTESCLNKKE